MNVMPLAIVVLLFLSVNNVTADMMGTDNDFDYYFDYSDYETACNSALEPPAELVRRRTLRLCLHCCERDSSSPVLSVHVSSLLLRTHSTGIQTYGLEVEVTA